MNQSIITSGSTLDPIPVGTMMIWSGPAESIPDQWLVADGSTITRREHPGLWAILDSRPRWRRWLPRARIARLPDMRAESPVAKKWGGTFEELGLPRPVMTWMIRAR